MSVQSFTQDHFALNKGVLCTKFLKPIVILFTHGENNIIGPHIQNFESLSRVCQSVAFAIVNVRNFPNLRSSSLQTNTPINSAVTLVLYNQGRPLAKLVPSAPQQMNAAINTALRQALQRQQAPKNTQANMYGAAATRSANTHTYYPNELQQPKFSSSVFKGVQQQDYSTSDETLFMPPDAIPYNAAWIAEMNYE